MSGSAPATSILRIDSRLASRLRTLGYSSSMWGLVTSSPAAAARRRKVSLSSHSWLEMGYHPLNNAYSDPDSQLIDRWRQRRRNICGRGRPWIGDRPGWWTLWLREGPLAIAVAVPHGANLPTRPHRGTVRGLAPHTPLHSSDTLAAGHVAPPAGCFGWVGAGFGNAAQIGILEAGRMPIVLHPLRTA